MPSHPALLDQSRATWHGQLTAQGVAQLVDTGAGLRAWLVGDGGGLLPSTVEQAQAAGTVKVRSTGTRRTVQSAQSLIMGLYPPSGGDDVRAPLAMEVRDRLSESMFPNPGMACERLEELVKLLDGDDVVAAAEASAWERVGLSAVRDAVHARNLEKRVSLRKEAVAAVEASAAAAAAAAAVSPSSTDASSVPASQSSEAMAGAAAAAAAATTCIPSSLLFVIVRAAAASSSAADPVIAFPLSLPRLPVACDAATAADTSGLTSPAVANLDASMRCAGAARARCSVVAAVASRRRLEAAAGNAASSFGSVSGRAVTAVKGGGPMAGVAGLPGV